MQAKAWCKHCGGMVPVQRRTHGFRNLMALLLAPVTFFISVLFVKMEPNACTRCGTKLGFRTGPKTVPGASFFGEPLADVLLGVIIGGIVGAASQLPAAATIGLVVAVSALFLLLDHSGQVQARKELKEAAAQGKVKKA